MSKKIIRSKKNSSRKTTTKKFIEPKVEDEPVITAQSNNLRTVSEEQIETPETVQPTILERIENGVKSVNQVVFNQATNVFFVSALMLIGLILIQSKTSFLKSNPEILLVPSLGGLIAAFTCSISIVLEVYFAYRNLKKIADDKNRKTFGFVIKAVLWTLKKRKIWTFTGAILISFFISGQLDINSIFQLTKQYNQTALAIFALAQMLVISFIVYTAYTMFYRIVLEPINDLVIKFIGISLSPDIPFKRIMGILIGGTTLYVSLMLTACLIDPQILGLSNDLTNQVIEMKKTLAKNQQFR